ncbi:hypothetical protein FN846DRAFT_966004 [Sphaerosporella brunnea]|uniref:Sec23/Sec24 family protein n=1 Tax=Sphaerosporella brunnea TaxID=1250544 RepID=A0A5J5ELB5_9PEZI|nr:hypothetical protein FN846DRAFT_966004 [Sphaerosporella brunnea]
MADMGMFHALGQNDDPNDPNSRHNVAPPHFRAQPAPPPAGYQQAGAPSFVGQQPQPQYGLPPQPSPYQQQQSPHGAPPPSISPYPPPQQHSPYGPPQNAYGPPQQQHGGYDPVGGLAQQMSQVDLMSQQVGTVSKAFKKKGRAYHQLDQSPDAMGGGPNMPPFSPNVGDNLQPGFLMHQQQSMVSPMTPGGTQFPMQAGPNFMPQHPGSSGVSSTGGKIDPLLIPSIPAARDRAIEHFRTTVFPTNSRLAPPNASSDFIAIDQQNASPRICRLTMNAVPTTAEVLNMTHLPLALQIQPLAKPKPGEEPIPVLDFGEMGPPRCRRCRTYINPFMTFVAGGSKFQCNMCLFPNNEVPSEYYSPIDMSGGRMDREQRPELMRGTVEFVVPKEYWVKKYDSLPPADGKGGYPMRYLFLIDATEGAINRGSLEATVAGIREALYGESAYEDVAEGEVSEDGTKRRLPEGCKVSICTFDKEVHFYNLNPSLDQAQMVVMPDIEEPFLPFQEGLFVDPYESRSVIEHLLDNLPSFFVHLKNPEPALLPALTAALSALEKTGGKIICSLSTLPTWGPNRLVLREDTKIYGTDKEKTLFKTEQVAWRMVAGKMVEAGVGVDFFMTPSAYIDLAAIGHVAATTGGETFFYPNFVKERDSKKLADELCHTFHRATGYQALMKVRCSNGLQVTAYHGNFFQTGVSSADVEFSNIDEDKAVAVMFSHDGKLDPKLDAHFQSALLYTTKSGERRVRCSNVVAAVTEQVRDVVRWADQDAVLGVMAREAASRMIEKPLKEIRGALTEKCVEILAAYRKHCSSASGNPPGQLILPESLKEFSMYVLALLKCRGFRGGSVSSDLRVHSMRMLKAMSALELQLYLYPRIIPIHNMADNDGFAEPSGHLKLPAAMRASFAFAEEGGVYLVDNGQYLLLWLHSQVSPNLLVDLFGEGYDNLAALDPKMHQLPVLQTALNAQVRNIIQFLASQRCSRKVSLQLARQGLDGAEYEFAQALVEDRNNDERSYVDWLVHVHKYIQLEMSGQRKKDEGIGAGIDMAAGMAGLRPHYW